jgi:hypothetical protein
MQGGEIGGTFLSLTVLAVEEGRALARPLALNLVAGCSP